MTSKDVYLDHAASTPLLREARDAISNVMAMAGNPSSVHNHGRALFNIIETARGAVALRAGAKRSEVVFTGSATEAITQAIVGSVAQAKVDQVIISGGEHSATVNAAKISGAEIITLGLSSAGVIDLEMLTAALKQADQNDQKALIAVHHVNNETGVVQPIPEVEKLVGPSRHLLFVDAVQGFAKLPISFSQSEIDMVAITAHKIGGPAGIGALLVKNHCDQIRIIPGGGQEQGRRGGTQSAILIAAFGAAAESLGEHIEIERLKELTSEFENRLRKICPQVVIFGEQATRIGSICNFALPELHSPVVMMALDMDHISVSAGSACASGKVSSSHVLAAMGVSQELAQCAIRVSVGWTSTKKDIDRLLDSISQIINRQVPQSGTAA